MNPICLKSNVQGQKDGSASKSMHCSHRRLEFSPQHPHLEYLNTYNSSSRGIQCIWHLGTPTFTCTFNPHRHIDTKLKINFKTLQSNVKARVHVQKSEGVLQCQVFDFVSFRNKTCASNLCAPSSSCSYKTSHQFSVSQQGCGQSSSHILHKM